MLFKDIFDKCVVFFVKVYVFNLLLLLNIKVIGNSLFIVFWIFLFLY